MSKHDFYYDESEHSRKINYETVSALNYYDNFVTMIVGWVAGNTDVLQRHAAFEEKYADRKDRNGELKSTTLQQKRFKCGFASMNKQNVQFLDDFLSLFDENIYIYFSVSSKIEYLVLQLFEGYHNSPPCRCGSDEVFDHQDSCSVSSQRDHQVYLRRSQNFLGAIENLFPRKD